MMHHTKIFWLVDDDTDDRMAFEYAIRRIGRSIRLECIETENELALRLADKSLPAPEAIFVDVNIPGGWNCLAMLSESAKTAIVPVIIYSTAANDDALGRVKESHALTYCCKPEDFSELKILLQLVFDNLDRDLRKVLGSSNLNCLKFK